MANLRFRDYRIRHLQRLRDLQDETGGFTAFIPWTFQPANTELAYRNLPEVTAAEYNAVIRPRTLRATKDKRLGVYKTPHDWMTQFTTVVTVTVSRPNNWS
jgi:hypothetical protein